MKWVPVVALVVLLMPTASAAFLQEDFESFNLGGFSPELKPNQDWYTYTEGSDVGNVTDTAPILEGNRSFRVVGPADGQAADAVTRFTFTRPTQITQLNFTVQAEPIANNTVGSEQVISVQSVNPVRNVVQFYVLCRNETFTQACDFRVKFDYVDSRGQVLINSTLNETRFAVRLVFDWLDAEYRLFVNGVDDGVFPFLDLPANVGRLRFDQERGDVPMDLTLDVIELSGALAGGASAVEGDAATGLQNFAASVNFTTPTSTFLLGIVMFLIIVAGVIVPLVALGRDNTIIPSVGFFAMLAGLFMIDLEWWPEWIGIAMIILASAIVATLVRRFLLGLRDSGQGAGLVASTLGYFIIASSLLAFSGYAATPITLPSNPAFQQDDVGGNTTGTQQTFVGAVTECVFSLFSDCSRKTVTTTWQRITDTAGQIYGWVQAGMDFVFQLLTFRLPIPAIFNVMIVFPPAVALATYGIATIRGNGS